MTICPLATLEQPCPISHGVDTVGVPWSATPDISWPKAALIVTGCAIGGLIGGIGLAALATRIIGRRVWDTITGLGGTPA